MMSNHRVDEIVATLGDTQLYGNWLIWAAAVMAALALIWRQVLRPAIRWVRIAIDALDRLAKVMELVETEFPSFLSEIMSLKDRIRHLEGIQTRILLDKVTAQDVAEAKEYVDQVN